MGLTVIFTKNNMFVYWGDPEMEDFPFPITKHEYSIYDQKLLEEYDEYVEVGRGESSHIKEIHSMHLPGSVSFCWRWYDEFGNGILPYPFGKDMTPEMLSEQTEALGAYLDTKKDASEILPGDNTVGEIRNLYKLLSWAVSHGLGTEAA